MLVTAAVYFTATYLGQQIKLRIFAEKLLVISQRFFGIMPFRFYALADGIRRLFRAAHSSHVKNRRPTRNSNSPSTDQAEIFWEKSWVHNRMLWIIIDASSRHVNILIACAA